MWVLPYRFFGPPEFKIHLYYLKCKKCLGVTYYVRNVHNTCISQEIYSCLGQVEINVEKRRKIIENTLMYFECLRYFKLQLLKTGKT